jgi:hypothetical protein
MIAEIAFIGDPRDRMEITNPVGAGLYAVPAADTTFRVYQYDTVVGDECGAHRADLDARGVVALIAELRDEKTAQHVLFHEDISRFIESGADRFDGHALVRFNHISLHPGTDVIRNAGDIVFRLAGLHASAAADAFVDVDPHAVVVFGGIIVLMDDSCPSGRR